ncbi:phage tail protein [Amylibacter kogurei]|uniref:Phage tail protein n=1 Tax=Paramylibacter kogurei TaxID=1889778 RepID=A0A2G5K7W8_9RHOB|nr:phage tail tape measure protein [Amylibacter kogurei]PIB24960.1 phage tail protein [Amylibacter kogurei]
MADYISDIQDLDTQLDQLEGAISATTKVSAAFQAELAGMETSISAAGQQAGHLNKNLSSGLKSAFSDLVFEGAKLSDVLRNVAMSMIESTFNSSIAPLTDALGGALTAGLTGLFSGGLAFEKGGAFSQGRVMPFAKGGVVTAPTTFPMRGGTGLMGEAGPEAIMPLSRGADGALGVRTNGGGSVTVNMNITSPDVESFRRSQTQVAAGLNRAVQRGRRNF